jgi:outer membrane protein OmpA-like peptidoglycan-associated protein
MCQEDKRSAISFSVTLSSQLVTAALAMLTVEGAFVAFALSNRSVETGFTLFVLLAGVSFILSIVIAGKGITAARDAGFQGNWSLEAGKNYFNWQAILCLTGLVLFFGALFRSGTPVSFPVESKLTDLNAKIEALQSNIANAKNERQIIIDQLSSIRDQISLPIQSLMVLAQERQQTSYRVYFNINSSKLHPKAKEHIKQLVQKYISENVVSIELKAFADRIGNHEYNLDLSLRRATSVRDELIRRGISQIPIYISCYGEEGPQEYSIDGVAEPLNRKVEIVFRQKEIGVKSE